MDKRIRFYIYWILGFVLLGACAPGDKEDVYTEMRAFEDFSHINGDSVAIVPRKVRLKAFPVDIVNVFRAPQYCPDHARETVALSPLPQLFWMQQGIVSPEAASIAGKAGIAVVEDLCIMVEHKRLLGN